VTAVEDGRSSILARLVRSVDDRAAGEVQNGTGHRTGAVGREEDNGVRDLGAKGDLATGVLAWAR
jgi:hypothetical protein